MTSDSLNEGLPEDLTRRHQSAAQNKPVLASIIPDCHQVNSHILQSNDPKPDFLNRCTTWHTNVPQRPQDTCLPSHSHEAELQEPPHMDIFCLPPFWETTCDSNLTVHLISAQCSEHQTESRLIQRHLKQIMIEHELYNLMDQHTCQRLRKADISVGVSCSVLRVSGLAGKTFDDVDSDTSSMLDESDAEPSP
ncbi:uncharacterized protein F5147DRAFT_647725 [Suillus discolor]|uniref:Uncharacterized protein n=1 Tax=Suillus discolor TaxID=1912936 RepID=A0A9P7K174_9AGAM|nr:uncharacterized protein F5147DRAFT_647725 [Suillus discolor]KAG2119857.1 hypothetical protein F5147DRAFT_647725 [Suillus discolor]